MALMWRHRGVGMCIDALMYYIDIHKFISHI